MPEPESLIIQAILKAARQVYGRELTADSELGHLYEEICEMVAARWGHTTRSVGTKITVRQLGEYLAIAQRARG